MSSSQQTHRKSNSLPLLPHPGSEETATPSTTHLVMTHFSMSNMPTWWCTDREHESLDTNPASAAATQQAQDTTSSPSASPPPLAGLPGTPFMLDTDSGCISPLSPPPSPFWPSSPSSTSSPPSASPPDSPKRTDEPDGVLSAVFVNTVKTVVLRQLKKVLFRYRSTICNGCTTDHPSQMQHECLFDMPDYFLRRHYDEVLKRFHCYHSTGASCAKHPSVCIQGPWCYRGLSSQPQNDTTHR